MNAEPRLRAEDLFDRLLDIDPSERDAWLVRACGADQKLREEVDGLLEHHRQVEGGDFLEPLPRSLWPRGSGATSRAPLFRSLLPGAGRTWRPSSRGGFWRGATG